nr:hypothetical protein [Tanacetum cinerariifolium]
SGTESIWRIEWVRYGISKGSFDFAAAIVFSKPYSFRPCCLIGVIGGVLCASVPYLFFAIFVFVGMERGFLDNGNKKKKKDGDGVKKDAMDAAANVGIAVKVKFIDGKLRKPIRNAPITMDVPAMGSIKGRDSHLEKVYTYYALNTWRKFGFEKTTRNDDGVYLFKFASKFGMDQVLEKGPWLIRKSPIILNKWTPSVSLKKGEVANVPVWVKNVQCLGSCLFGGWIESDCYSNCSMCMESWGRISFARALIKVSASSALKKEIIMAVLEDEGDGYVKEEVPNNSARVTKATTMEENDDGFTEVKSRKKKKGVDFGGIRLNKPKSKVMWQQKKGVDAKSNSTSPFASSNAVGNDKGVSNLGLNTFNPFDVLNVDGDAMGESGKQLKDVINEDDTTDDEDVFNSYGDSFSGGNQLKDEDFDFYEGYADQVVDLDGDLKEFRDFKLSMSVSLLTKKISELDQVSINNDKNELFDKELHESEISKVIRHGYALSSLMDMAYGSQN